MTTISASVAATANAEPEEAEALAARKQILDQVEDAKT